MTSRPRPSRRAQRLLVVAEGKLPALGRLTAPMIVVPDVLVALEKAGIAARARIHGQDHRRHRLGRQDHAPRRRCATCCRPVGKVHASDKSFNNHWGVPLTLARMPADTRLRRLRDRHEPCRRDPPAGQDGAAACRHRHADRARRISAISTRSTTSPAPRRRSSRALEPGGAALLNRDDAALDAAGERWPRTAGVQHRSSASARTRERSLPPDECRAACRPFADSRPRSAARKSTCAIGAPGRHIVQNALAVLGAARLAGADLTPVVAALADADAGQWARQAPSARRRRRRRSR